MSVLRSTCPVHDPNGRGSHDVLVTLAADGSCYVGCVIGCDPAAIRRIVGDMLRPAVAASGKAGVS